MSVKERVIKRIEAMDQARLLELEHELAAQDAKVPDKSLEAKLRALEAITGMITDSKDLAVLEQETRRRPLFGANRPYKFGLLNG